MKVKKRIKALRRKRDNAVLQRNLLQAQLDECRQDLKTMRQAVIEILEELESVRKHNCDFADANAPSVRYAQLKEQNLSTKETK